MKHQYQAPSQTTDTKNISRIDIEASDLYPDRRPTHGWQVRIRRQGKRHTKFFSDARHGGPIPALEAARQYRDALIEELPEPGDHTAAIQARSTSGVPGLHFIMRDDGSGTLKPYIQMSWINAAGQRRGAAYSLDKWGLRRALWNACQRLFRERQHSYLFGKGDRPQSAEEMYAISYPKISKQFDESCAPR